MGAEFLAGSRRVTIFVGDFGSGKTEIAINFAIALRSLREEVKIADLDIVNPYFRTREVSEVLARAGVELIAPPGEQVWADIPIIVPEVEGAIRDRSATVVLDVGGEEAGSRVLGSLSEAIAGSDYDLWAVVNANRPFASDAQATEKVVSKILKASRLRLTGIVSNTHLLDETTPKHAIDGYRIATALARRLGVGVKFVSVEKRVAEKLDRSIFDVPIFAIQRYLLPPWEKASRMTAAATEPD